MTWLSSGSDHGAVSFAGSSDASAVASSTNVRWRGTESEIDQRHAFVAQLRRRHAEQARKHAGPKSQAHERFSIARADDAVVSGPATMMRPSMRIRSMQPSGSTRTGSGGPSTTHAHSTRSRSAAGGGNSR